MCALEIIGKSHSATVRTVQPDGTRATLQTPAGEVSAISHTVKMFGLVGQKVVRLSARFPGVTPEQKKGPFNSKEADSHMLQASYSNPPTDIIVRYVDSDALKEFNRQAAAHNN